MLALDLPRIEVTEGFVESGGEGRLENCGVVVGVGEEALGTTGAAAIVGDCSGDWIGLEFLDISEKTGGSKGVVACGCSSS